VTHLSAEQLADVDAIAGDAHLVTCQRCRDQWQQQRAVRDLLRGLPDPGTIPPDVATGLTDALARLSRADVETAPAASRRAGPAGATVIPLGTSAPRRDWLSRARPWLTAAAAVIVLGGGASALVTHPWSGAGSATDSAATTAGSSAERQSSAAPGLAATAAARVRSTGTDYDRKHLATQVRRVLLSEATGTAAPSKGAFDDSSASGDTRLASPDGLASCVSALGLDVGQVTAVDLARFDGAPAAVVVLRGAGGEQDVWVVGRGCRQGDDQTTYFVRLP